MKIKLAAYAAAAMLVGFAIMMLPLALETGPPSYDPQQAPPAYPNSFSEGGNEQRTQPDNTYGTTATPYIVPSGLILLAGLAAAIAAYASVRKLLK